MALSSVVTSGFGLIANKTGGGGAASISLSDFSNFIDFNENIEPILRIFSCTDDRTVSGMELLIDFMLCDKDRPPDFEDFERDEDVVEDEELELEFSELACTGLVVIQNFKANNVSTLRASVRVSLIMVMKE